MSSTKIRKAIEEGDIALANSYLGDPFTLEGVVVHGDKGRELSYPLQISNCKTNIKSYPTRGLFDSIRP